MAVELRGSTARLALISAGYLTLTAGVGSYVLLGEGWPRFFVFSFLFCSIPIVLLSLFLRGFDRMVLDDDARLIRRPLRRAIPYDSISGFHVHNSGGMASLTTSKGGPILIYSFTRTLEGRLRNEMYQRWPDAAVSRSSNSSVWYMLALTALPLALGAAYSWNLEQRFAGFRDPCEPVNWRMESSGPRDLQIGPFAVGVPEGFAPAAGDRMAYASESADIAYSIEPPASDGLSQAVMRYGLGVRGSSGMIRWGACATSGFLPLTAKASLFGEGSTERVVFLGGVAVLRQSELGGNALIAFAGPQEIDLMVTVNFEGEIDSKLLEQVVGLVGFGRQRLARRTD